MTSNSCALLLVVAQMYWRTKLKFVLRKANEWWTLWNNGNSNMMDSKVTLRTKRKIKICLILFSALLQYISILWCILLSLIAKGQMKMIDVSIKWILVKCVWVLFLWHKTRSGLCSIKSFSPYWNSICSTWLYYD